MTLKNKLGIGNSIELARQEERLSKIRAQELFDQGIIDSFEVGTYRGLSAIHRYLFQDVYEFAGEMRAENIAKNNFRFASAVYLPQALESIGKMPQTTFDEIIEKYVEMNVAHPFWEGNGRSTRIWLDVILRKELGRVVDWSRINKEDYLLAMERSPVRDLEIKALLQNALTDKIADREVFMKGIDASYKYEGLEMYEAGEIPYAGE
ncbi:MAG: cell filamentation protein Fic [Eggerthellaceae bacterium]|nr:cell filamentation protein Fic [Eggerthellaceae bacterium]